MRFLHALLAVIMTASLWSGGVTWGADADEGVWMPDGASPSGRPVPAVAIAGASVLNSIQSASWGLGPSDPFADLEPSTATLTFTGQVDAAPDEDVVISTGWGALWGGRIVSVSQTRDTAGNWTTSITATDKVGQMGGAALRKNNGKTGDLVTIIGYLSRVAGVRVNVTDSSTGTYGLPDLARILYFGETFTGSMLEYLNIAARSSNAMVALQPDGTLRVMTREALMPDQVSNGTFETNTSGWADFNTGTITRITSDFHSGAACAQIVSGTGYGGATYTITADLKARHTYRFSFWAKRTVGTGDWVMDYYSNPTQENFTPTGSWAQYSVAWTMAADASSITLVIRDDDTTTGTLLVDDVTFEEAGGLVLDGDNAPASWTRTLAWGSDVNRWSFTNPDGTDLPDTTIAADILAHGERAYTVDNFLDVDTGSGVALNFLDWWGYTPTARWQASGEFVVSDLSQEELLTLAPLDWITVDGTDWQVMSMAWTIDGPGQPMRLAITADDFIGRLEVAS